MTVVGQWSDMTLPLTPASSKAHQRPTDWTDIIDVVARVHRSTITQRLIADSVGTVLKSRSSTQNRTHFRDDLTIPWPELTKTSSVVVQTVSRC